jgi:hypothetical protein
LEEELGAASLATAPTSPQADEAQADLDCLIGAFHGLFIGCAETPDEPHPNHRADLVDHGNRCNRQPGVSVRSEQDMDRLSGNRTVEVIGATMVMSLSRLDRSF